MPRLIDAAEPEPAAFNRPAAPWARAGGLLETIKEWRTGRHRHAITLDVEVPSSAGRSAPLPSRVAPALRYALKARGIDALYIHQAAAFTAALRGEDVVVATPTASGKSLCYHLPVLDALAQDPEARALYLFPTKALSRDQEAAVRGLLKDASLDRGAITFDGDTPPDARRVAKDRSSILISNPDMLHAGILPNHPRWSRFFANLRFVVIDELHMYRGVFGSHLGNVVRRLLRIARFHGARPQMIFSSATIGNPLEHAKNLSGRQATLIDESGAPAGSRTVLVHNPPVVNAELGIRKSYVKETVRLAGDLLQSGVSTLVFGQSRNQVEVMLKYLRDRFEDHALPADAIMAYRGGYLPKQRREIERRLRSGEIRGVVSTNALELGIDIGALDAVICAGYPGTMAGTWQRFGRAGRRNAHSLAVMVASSAPLDQYLATHAELLMDAPIEHARIDPDNVEILIQHLKCASFELPFEAAEGFGSVQQTSVADAMDFLADHGVVRPVVSRTGTKIYHWSTESYPANHVSLRSPSWDNFVIIDVESTRTIAEMDFRSTHSMLHEQAIYQHDGVQYQVEVLDYENHKAFVRRVAPDYYTTAKTNKRVAVLAENESEWRRRSDPPALLGWGEVNVVEKVVGFKKIKFHTHENVGYGEVTLPEIQKPTTAFWLTVPEALLDAVDAPRSVQMDALAGFAQVLRSVAAVGLMTDPRDIGTAVVDEQGLGDGGGQVVKLRKFEPTLYLYDSIAGGVGLAPRLYEDRESLLLRGVELVRACACQTGCPSCIGPEHDDRDSLLSRKRVLLDILSRLEAGSAE